MIPANPCTTTTARCNALLRYDIKLKPEVGENTVPVWLIDWQHVDANDFAFADEVTLKGADAKAATKRPDIVLYVNGIAQSMLELKRSTVSVSEGIRWNCTEGLRYGTIETPEKYYLTWVEEGGDFAARQHGAGQSNATLVAGSIYEACEYYEPFSKTELKGKCAIVSSYAPHVADSKGESTGAGDTDNLFKYGGYQWGTEGLGAERWSGPSPWRGQWVLGSLLTRLQRLLERLFTGSCCRMLDSLGVCSSQLDKPAKSRKTGTSWGASFIAGH